MADQVSSHASITSAVSTFYSKTILKAFEPDTHFYGQAPVKEAIPKGEGKTVSFTRYNSIPALYSNDTDEFTAQQIYLTAVSITATLHERDGYVQLSRYTVLTARNSVLERAVERVKASAVKTLDKLIRNDIGMMVADVANASSLNYANMLIDNSSNTLHSSGISARVWSHDTASAGDRFPMYHNKIRLAQSATVVSFASSGMTVKTMQHGVKILAGLDIDKIGGFYKAIMHPDTAYQITTNAGFKGWFSPTSSAEAKQDPTMVGVVAGVKVFTSTQAYKFALSGDTLDSSSGNLYCTLLFGQDAYGVAEISGNQGRSGFNFFLKESGPQSTNDPTNKKRQIGFSITSVGKILNKSAGLWILTTGL